MAVNFTYIPATQYGYTLQNCDPIKQKFDRERGETDGKVALSELYDMSLDSEWADDMVQYAEWVGESEAYISGLTSVLYG